MRVAERELDRLALHLGAVPDPDDLEPALEAVLHPPDHVGDERPREPVQRAHFPIVAGALDDDATVGELCGETRRDRLRELALRALRPDGGALDLDLDALRNDDGLLADARHAQLLTTRTPGLRRRPSACARRGR